MSDSRAGAAIEAAHQAMRQGRPDEAARHWERVLQLFPEHPDALFHLGQHALFRKDPARARSLLERAAARAPQQPAILLNLSFVSKATGDAEGEMAALIRALTIDPYFYPALLAKAALLERLGRRRQAAQDYKHALTILPPDEKHPAPVQAQIRHAREVVAKNAAAVEAHVRQRLAPLVQKHAGAKLGRFEECRDIALGRAKIQHQAPQMLHFPRLPEIGFHDRDDFPWLADLEAGSEIIRDELLALLREENPGLKPYLQHPDGAPLNQWAELNRSPRWSAYFLWEAGTRIEAHCAKFPRTAAIVERLPLCDQPGFAPTVNFSILTPKTRLPPHTGDVNTRLIVHLPLIIPPKCVFRVGNESRPWRFGEAWVFDDTIDHEARNDSDQLRAILMLDIWNPALSLAERDLVTALLAAQREYYGVG
jgi:aspartyl/asparaginyl beta-hydroxylase (cupin superfamily)